MVIDENDGFRKVLEALAEAADDSGFSTVAKSYAKTLDKTYTDEEIKEGMIKLMTGGSVSPSLGKAIHLKYDHFQPGFECDCDQPKKENVIQGRFPRKKTQAKKKSIEIPFDPTSQS